MSPFKPAAPPTRRREPMFNAPGVVVALAAALLAIQAAMSAVDGALADRVVYAFGFVPARLTAALWPQALADLAARAASDTSALEQAQAIRDMLAFAGGGARPWTLATYAALHGSWTHVGLNVVWLAAFGPPVARRFGTARFLLFALAAAVAGALAHWALQPLDATPLIGVSAVDSALMGAATRFVFQPGGPLGPAGHGWPRSPEDAARAPAPSLVRLVAEGRAVGFVLLWLVTNFVFGAGAQTLGLSEAPIAWVAHLGGFALGLLAFAAFDPRR